MDYRERKAEAPDRIPLSEIRWWFHGCAERFPEMDRRAHVVLAVACAQGEYDDARRWPIDDPAPAAVPMTDTRSPREGGLPW